MKSQKVMITSLNYAFRTIRQQKAELDTSSQNALATTMYLLRQKFMMWLQACPEAVRWLVFHNADSLEYQDLERTLNRFWIPGVDVPEKQRAPRQLMTQYQLLVLELQTRTVTQRDLARWSRAFEPSGDALIALSGDDKFRELKIEDSTLREVSQLFCEARDRVLSSMLLMLMTLARRNLFSREVPIFHYSALLSDMFCDSIQFAYECMDRWIPGKGYSISSYVYRYTSRRVQDALSRDYGIPQIGQRSRFYRPKHLSYDSHSAPAQFREPHKFVSDVVEGSVPDPETALMQKEFQAHVRSVVASLPESDRTALEMRLVQEKSVAETAEALGMTNRASVSNCVLRGRRRVQEQLGGKRPLFVDRAPRLAPVSPNNAPLFRD